MHVVLIIVLFAVAIGGGIYLNNQRRTGQINRTQRFSFGCLMLIVLTILGIVVLTH